MSGVIDGGDGDDFIAAGFGHGTIHGGNENDTRLASKGHDVIDGRDGVDRPFGCSGSHLLYGRAGEDEIEGGRTDGPIEGGADTDTLIETSGRDTLSDQSSSAGVRVNLQTGSAGDGNVAGDIFSGFENLKCPKPFAMF